MASQSVNIGINVTDNGSTEKINKTVQKLHSLLKQTQAVAEKISVGGTTGSRSAAARAQPGPVAAAAAEVADYGRMRGAAGATGASARDFANQAQGLGGLVRLYATFAANVFAVSAAFSALRTAMDTTNMIRGLDALGAASGQNLGSLSKRLIEVSDGALSMRDAMEAVAKTSAAGMGQKDLLRLTQVAKNASSVLGLNLPDSMSRLTRAVTKLEPELLDELGIMTRIEPAVEAYARQVGKSASQLSQLERQQAFLNAVLTEGEQKFGALGTGITNPYDKLLASLKNTLQTGLEYVNKVLGPIVELLASSPTGLALALGAVAASLVRQALPAITQFKAGLQRSAEDARQVASERAKEAKAATDALNKQILKDLSERADQEIQRVDAAEKKIQELKQGTLSKNSAAYKLLQKTAQEVTDAELANVRRLATRYENRGLKEKADAYREVANAQEASRAAESAYSQKEREVTDERKRSVFYMLTQKAEINANEAATKKSIISNAAYNASLIGLRGSWQLMNAQIAESSLAMGKLESAALKTRAGIAILGGAIGALGVALNAALGWIGLIVAAVGIVDSVFSKASKQISEFNSAIDTLESNADATARAVDRLNNIGGAGSTISGINAISNSLRELGDSAEEAIAKISKAQFSMGIWDKIKDLIASGFGGGLANNLADAIGKSVVEAIKGLEKTPLAATAKESFRKLLGTEALDQESIAKAFKALDDATKGRVVDQLKQLSLQVTDSSNKLNNFKTANDAVKKSFEEFIQSTANTNPLFRLGANLEELGVAMAKLENKGIKELDAALLDLAKDPSRAAVFGQNFATGLINIRSEFEESANAVAVYSTLIQDLERQIKDIQKVQVEGFDPVNNAAIKKLTAQRQALEKAFAEIPQGPIIEARKLFAEGIQTAFEKGAKFISQAIGDAEQKAALARQKAAAETLTGPRRVLAETELQRKELDLQLEAIKTNVDLILSQEKLTATIEEANAIAASRDIKQKPGATAEEILTAETRVEVAKIFKKILSEASGGDFKTQVETQLQASTLAEPERAKVRLSTLGVSRQFAQQEASRIGIQGQKDLVTVQGLVKYERERVLEAEKFKRLIDDINRVQGSLLSTQIGIAGTTSRIAIDTENTVASTTLQNKQQEELSALEARRLAVIRLGAAQSELDAIDKERLFVVERQRFETENQQAQNRQRITTRELQDLNKRYELETARAALNSTNAELRLGLIEEETRAYNQLYGVTQGFQIVEENSLARQRASLELSRAQAEAERAIQQKRQEAETRKGAISPDTAEGRSLRAEIDIDLARQEELNRLTQAGNQAQYEQRLKILDITQKTNLEQLRYNGLLDNARGAAESLAQAFGNIGQAVGGVVTSFSEFVVNSDKGSKALKQIETNQSKVVKGSAQWTAYEEQRQEQISQNTKQELTGAANVLGATKKLFKEKTVAYKLLATTEKALHIMRLAMDAKELAVKLGFLAKGTAAKVASEGTETAVAQTGFLARIGTYISEIFAKFTAMLGPFGPPLAVAAIAAIGLSAFSRGGGGKAFTPSAEQRQQTQGTAMSWNASGQKVQTSTGVLGDTEAKSQSIARSLELIKETSVDGLVYDNKVVNLLTSIDQGINNTAKGLYSIRGLRTGSMFGTIEGSQSGRGLLGTGLFASKTSRTISDTGLIIEGTFAQLASDTNKSVIDFFEEVTVSKRNWYGKTKTWVESYREEVDDGTSRFFREIFGNAAQLFVEVGKEAGIDRAMVQGVLENFNVGKQFASLRGLKGAEFEKELSAIISSTLDIAAERVFSSFSGFQKFGEGMLETVIRVTDTNKKVTQALKNIGVTSGWLALPDFSLQITNDLADAAGGLDEFLSSIEYFRENFLTEAERLKPIENSVSQELTRLGFGFVKTKDQFVKAVQSVNNLVSATDQQTLASLLNIQEDFFKIATAAEEAAEKQKQEAESANDKIRQEAEQLNKRLLEIQGKTNELRALELETISEVNRELQKRIWSLEDQQAAAKNLQSSLNNLTKTLQQQVDTLRNYTKSLNLSTNTTLTATQQYTAARKEIDSLLQIIASPARTAEEISLRNTAIGNLTTATDKWIGLSRELFAGGMQYTKDFALVRGIIDSVANTLEFQLTDAQKQLTALETSNSFLQSIDSASKTTNELLTAYLEAGGVPIPSASYAKGTGFVPQDMAAQVHRGERIIPAMDNFRLMTQVNNTDNYTREMLAEIKKLNAKINTLERTVAEGAIINAEATNNNTQQITQVFVQTSDKTIQSSRLQVKASIK